uniref:Uncharacterized protein n=1 Tax=Micrurus spixii TaxID=129469 RepID=A0A2D4LWX5_9SAUR
MNEYHYWGGGFVGFLALLPFLSPIQSEVADKCPQWPRQDEQKKKKHLEPMALHDGNPAVSHLMVIWRYFNPSPSARHWAGVTQSPYASMTWLCCEQDFPTGNLVIWIYCFLSMLCGVHTELN